MKWLRFRLLTMVVLVAAIALILAAIAAWWRLDRPRFLTPGDSPFLVMAQIYEGPGSEQKAFELATELRSKHHLSAFLFQIRPSKGKYEGRNETAVLVGDAKTQAEALALMKRVRKIKPQSQPGLRKLSRATMTQNPLIPSSYLFKPAASGPRSPISPIFSPPPK